MQMSPNACPSIYCCRGIETGPRKPCQPQITSCRASVGLEIDLIRIQIYAFDLTFVRRTHPRGNVLERTEGFCWHLQNNGQFNCPVRQGVHHY